MTLTTRTKNLIGAELYTRDTNVRCKSVMHVIHARLASIFPDVKNDKINI